MRIYELECYDKKQLEANLVKDFKHNEYICETAGFVPLEVKFKRFEQAGIRARISSSDYTSSDYRDMYLNPDYQVYPDDEIEDVEESFRALHDHIEKVKKRASAREATKAEKLTSAAAAAEVKTKQSSSVDTEEKVTSKD